MNNTKHRSYLYNTTNTNQTKLDKIRELLPPWRSALITIQYKQIQKLKNGESLGWLSKQDLNFNNPLSQRQLVSCVNQVNNNLRSWFILTENDIRDYITNLNIQDDDLRYQAYLLNKLNEYWLQENTLIITKNKQKHVISITQEAKTIITSALGESLKQNPWPNFSKTNTMIMSDQHCVPEVNHSSKNNDAWLRVSTLTPRQVVRVPVKYSDYDNSRVGSLTSITQVRVDPVTGEVSFKRILESPASPVKTTGETIGLDWGMKCLFTTSEGDRLGQSLYERLKTLDAQLLELEQRLKANNVPLKKSKRYCKLNHRLRESVKNEINRVLNRLIKTRDIRELVVEDLDFRHGGLSRKLNRLLNRYGRAAVRVKLDNLSEDTGVIITRVNPAYSSRECSKCGFVSESNRRSQSCFECSHCGYSCNADVNASRVIKQRRSLFVNGLLGLGKDKVLIILDQRFTKLHGYSFDRVSEQLNSSERGDSTAGLVLGNQVGS